MGYRKREGTPRLDVPQAQKDASGQDVVEWGDAYIQQLNERIKALEAKLKESGK